MSTGFKNESDDQGYDNRAPEQRYTYPDNPAHKACSMWEMGKSRKTRIPPPVFLPDKKARKDISRQTGKKEKVMSIILSGQVRMKEEAEFQWRDKVCHALSITHVDIELYNSI